MDGSPTHKRRNSGEIYPCRWWGSPLSAVCRPPCRSGTPRAAPFHACAVRNGPALRVQNRCGSLGTGGDTTGAGCSMRVFCVWAPGCTTYKNALWSILSIHRPRHRLYCLRAPWLVSKIVLGVSRLRVPSRRVFVTDECPGVSRLVRRLLAEFCSKIARNHNDQCQLRTSRGII